MKKILTALQNKKINEKLSNEEEIKIMMNDIQYKEGILEALEIEPDIDFIIMSELLPGEIKIEKLIEKIKQMNNNIKIIIILENKKEELENYLLSKGKIFIFYNNEITIEQLLKIINEKYNQEKLEKEINEIKKIINKEKINLNKNEEEKIEENNYIISEEEKENLENEIEEEFKSQKIFYKLKKLINKKEKNIKAQMILIMGSKGCRKNNIYYQFSETI
ncbi:MAG: hypothetical protein J6A04_06110 [Clostridia bacterium]|nr:hypothetical protein [Clostridia bacterium]